MCSLTDFEMILDLFADFYSVVDLTTVERAANGAALPPCPLLITFDDGWRDNYETAYPILRAHGVPAAPPPSVATGGVPKGAPPIFLG